MIRMLRLLAASMALVLVVTHGAVLVAANLEIVASPDHRLRAVIKPAGPEGTESRVEIQTSDGKPLCVKDYSSEDGEHRLSVAESRWTPDSRFFVFSTSSSGGHQAWHSPTFFYSRSNNSIRNVEDLSHRVVLDQAPELTFKIVPPHSVATVSPGTLYGVKGSGKNNDFIVLLNLETGEVSQQTKWPAGVLP